LKNRFTDQTEAQKSIYLFQKSDFWLNKLRFLAIRPTIFNFLQNRFSPMKKYISEFIGTFFFVLTFVMACNNGAGNFAPLAIGAALMVMIFAGGQYSGGHFNPAVTLAVWMRGRLAKGEVLPYMGAQILGATIAALIGSFLLGALGKSDAISAGHPEFVSAVVAEFLGTFALVWVFLNVSTTKSNENNAFYGLAIGFTVLAMVYALGPISGGAFNPAVAVGISITRMANWSDIWIYFLGCFLGGAAASSIFTVVHGRD
jgi:aquaporin Z